MSDPFRLKLHEKLCNILGSNHVYYQPPENLKMTYPAIVYYLNSLPSNWADNGIYLIKRQYTVVLITKEPEPTQLYGMLTLPRCSFSNRYISDGLNHYSYSITE